MNMTIRHPTMDQIDRRPSIAACLCLCGFIVYYFYLFFGDAEMQVQVAMLPFAKWRSAQCKLSFKLVLFCLLFAVCSL
jgi:hypothetical protein